MIIYSTRSTGSVVQLAVPWTTTLEDPDFLFGSITYLLCFSLQITLTSCIFTLYFWLRCRVKMLLVYKQLFSTIWHTLFFRWCFCNKHSMHVSNIKEVPKHLKKWNNIGDLFGQTFFTKNFIMIPLLLISSCCIYSCTVYF